MRTSTVSRAKATLSDLLRRAERGESILIVNRGRPVAVLGPPGPARAGSEGEWLADLERRGILRRPARRDGLRFLRKDRVGARGAARREPDPLVEAILAEREEGP